MKMREIINILVEHNRFRDEINDRLDDPNLSDDERGELIHQHGIVDDLEWTPDGDLVIWRAMNVSEDWIKKAKSGNTHLGIYWSHQPNTAHPYNDEGGVIFLMKGVIAGDQVSWEGIWSMHDVGENEVQLAEGDKVKIIGVWLDDKPLSLSNWLGQTFEA